MTTEQRIEKKVYCGDCKWEQYGVYCNSSITPVVGDNGFCSYKNRDNDCKDYKRKWWKVWV